MRVFVAVDVPAEVRQAIEDQVVAPFRQRLSGARWTRPGGRHLTLAFLGEVDAGRVGAIGDAVAVAVAAHAPFDAAFADLGVFPGSRRPRVLWLGLGAGAESMATLARDVRNALVPLGFEPERRPFRAHLTLARFPSPHALGALPEAVVPPLPFAVREVAVVRSELHPTGARYTVLERAPLGGATV